jgi:pimeloyl-ACP methyl ester carboxylesterase
VDNRTFTPPGEMIACAQGSYHVRRWGARGPLVLLECGLTLMSACWAWIAPELSGFARVVAYDRAGLGWSTPREEPRDAPRLARELFECLEAAAPGEQVVLCGHSMGAMINRAFFQAHPARVKAFVWLDPAHPVQVRRRGIRRRMRNLVFWIEAAQLLAVRGLPAMEIPLFSHWDRLPDADFRTLRRFLRNPAHLRTCAREERAWEASADALHGDGSADLPLLMISGQKNSLPGWNDVQAELATFSSRTVRRTFTAMSHVSMLARPEHAKIVVAEIADFLKTQA